MSRYIFDNAAPQAGQRFASLETLYDPGTIRALATTGVGPGWRCLEIGGGGGSIAAWLADRVGTTGHVLVTDIDPHFLAALAALDRPNIEVRQHDIGTDPLPEGAFDLIHARLVLIHVPTRREALGRLVAALRPGGWLVVEDFGALLVDRLAAIADPAAAALFAKLMATLRTLMRARGHEDDWGRKLHQHFREHGLVDVAMMGQFAVWPGGSPGAALDRANLGQVRAEAVAAGLITDDEVDRILALLDDPGFSVFSPVMLTASGRRP